MRDFEREKEEDRNLPQHIFFVYSLRSSGKSSRFLLLQQMRGKRKVTDRLIRMILYIYISYERHRCR
jgi:hypothetical protein